MLNSSKNVPNQERSVSAPSVIVTRLVPLIITAQILVTLGIYPFLANIVPSHWNSAGQIDSYQPKWAYAGFLPLFSLILYFMLAVFFIFPRSSSQERDEKPMEVSTREAAALIGKSELMIQQYIQNGKIQARHLDDGRNVINLNELEGIRSNSRDRETAKMILKFIMVMQQGIFFITQIILLIVALRTGSGAVH